MSNQKPRTIEEQIKLLRSRGMQFSSEEYAKECLSHISYFRLILMPVTSTGNDCKVIWLTNFQTHNK